MILINRLALKKLHYHWLWGLRYSDDENIISIDSQLNALSDSQYEQIVKRHEEISNFHPFIRFFYRLFNIDNYTNNAYLIYAHISCEKYDEYCESHQEVNNKPPLYVDLSKVDKESEQKFKEHVDEDMFILKKDEDRLVQSFISVFSRLSLKESEISTEEALGIDPNMNVNMLYKKINDIIREEAPEELKKIIFNTELDLKDTMEIHGAHDLNKEIKFAIDKIFRTVNAARRLTWYEFGLKLVSAITPGFSYEINTEERTKLQYFFIKTLSLAAQQPTHAQRDLYFDLMTKVIRRATREVNKFIKKNEHAIKISINLEAFNKELKKIKAVSKLESENKSIKLHYDNAIQQQHELQVYGLSILAKALLISAKSTYLPVSPTIFSQEYDRLPKSDQKELEKDYYEHHLRQSGFIDIFKFLVSDSRNFIEYFATNRIVLEHMLEKLSNENSVRQSAQWFKVILGITDIENNIIDSSLMDDETAMANLYLNSIFRELMPQNSHTSLFKGTVLEQIPSENKLSFIQEDFPKILKMIISLMNLKAASIICKSMGAEFIEQGEHYLAFVEKVTSRIQHQNINIRSAIDDFKDTSQELLELLLSKQFRGKFNISIYRRNPSEDDFLIISQFISGFCIQIEDIQKELVGDVGPYRAIDAKLKSIVRNNNQPIDRIEISSSEISQLERLWGYYPPGEFGDTQRINPFIILNSLRNDAFNQQEGNSQQQYPRGTHGFFQSHPEIHPESEAQEKNEQTYAHR